ncbi:17984_t:CDS:1, partial [Racocetra persica]
TLAGLTNISLMDPGYFIIYCAYYLFRYTALIGGNMCRCGNDTGLDAYIKLIDDNSINTTCNIKYVGNSSYLCGGKDGYRVYDTLTAISSYRVPNVTRS